MLNLTAMFVDMSNSRVSFNVFAAQSMGIVSCTQSNDPSKPCSWHCQLNNLLFDQ